MLTEKIYFPNHQGIPDGSLSWRPPVIDGYVEPEIGLMITTPTPHAPSDYFEGGYTGGPRITYLGESGLEHLVFQGVKQADGDFLYLSFIVRLAPSFSNDDRIVIALRPNFTVGAGAKTGQERRIDITPVQVGIGAASPSTIEDQQSVGNPGGHDIRKNSAPAGALVLQKWNLATSKWTECTSTDTTKFECKVRSWRGDPVPTGSGDHRDNCFSVEIKIPTTKAAAGGGTSDWIDLNTGADGFGLYFNVLMAADQDEPVTVPEGIFFMSYQFTWPRATYTPPYEYLLTSEADGDILHFDIPTSWLGQAFVGGGAANVHGVRFHGGGASGIGVKSGSTLTNVIDANVTNVFTARLDNDDTGQDAPKVSATFRMANWGFPPADEAFWTTVPVDVGYANPTPGVTVPKNSTAFDISTNWTMTPAQKGQYAGREHQCMHVSLRSDGDVYFVEASARRNMDFVHLSRNERALELSGEGYDPPDPEVIHHEPPHGGGSVPKPVQEFLLYAVVRSLGQMQKTLMKAKKAGLIREEVLEDGWIKEGFIKESEMTHAILKEAMVKDALVKSALIKEGVTKERFETHTALRASLAREGVPHAEILREDTLKDGILKEGALKKETIRDIYVEAATAAIDARVGMSVRTLEAMVEQKPWLIELIKGDGATATDSWLRIVTAFRRTPLKLKLGAKKYLIYQPVGTCGTVAFHAGTTKPVLKHAFEPVEAVARAVTREEGALRDASARAVARPEATVRALKPAVAHVTVPAGGTAYVNNVLVAEPPASAPPVTTPPAKLPTEGEQLLKGVIQVAQWLLDHMKRG